MRKSWLVTIASLLILASCERGNDISRLNIAVSSEPPTLDVMVNTSLISRIIAVGNIYEKLFVLDGEGKIRTELAESYGITSDGRVLTIRIRDGVPFHDGKIMDAEDVVSSLNRWLDRYGTANSFVSGSRFKAIDDDTIQIESDNSLILFPYLMASAPQSAVITEKRIIDSLESGELLTKYIGTGPYKLSSWRSGDRIELSRFDDYKKYGESSSGVWGQKNAYIDMLSYQFVPDSVTRRLGLQSGQFDFINDVMSEDRPVFERDENIYTIEGGESGSIALVFNKKEGIGTDVDFRKAVSLLLDYDSLLKACYGDYGYAVHSDYMEKEQTLRSVDASENPYKGQNIELAKKFLDRSGYNGKSVRILTSNLSNLDKIAVAMKSDFERVGIESEIESVDWASMIEKRKDSSLWDIYISAYSRVALPQMKSYLSPSYPGWIDETEEGMELLQEMNNTKSVEEASIIWQNAQRSFWESVPVVIPGHYTTVYGARKSVKGIISQDGFFFWNAEKEEL